MQKVPEKIAFATGLAALSLAATPMKADAFRINYYPITGDTSSELAIEADVLIEQGIDAGLEENQARWRVKLLSNRLGKVESE